MAIKYYVDEKNRKTVAVLEGCKYDAMNRIQKLTNNDASTDYFAVRDLTMPNSFKAVVTCNEMDEYDVEEGKRQAKKKLMQNYHRSMDKRIEKCRQHLMKVADMLKI